MLLSPHAVRVKVSLCSLEAQVRCCFNHVTPVMPLEGQRLLCHMGAILWAFRRHAGLLLFRRSRVFSKSRFDVLQVLRLFLFPPRRKGVSERSVNKAIKRYFISF